MNPGLSGKYARHRTVPPGATGGPFDVHCRHGTAAKISVRELWHPCFKRDVQRTVEQRAHCGYPAQTTVTNFHTDPSWQSLYRMPHDVGRFRPPHLSPLPLANADTRLKVCSCADLILGSSFEEWGN